MPPAPRKALSPKAVFFPPTGGGEAKLSRGGNPSAFFTLAIGVLRDRMEVVLHNPTCPARQRNFLAGRRYRRAHLGLASQVSAPLRGKDRRIHPRPLARSAPSRGQRQGLKNSPRSQRRSSRRPEQRKEGKAIERSVPCPDEQRRQKGAETDGRGEFPLVKLRKRKGK